MSTIFIFYLLLSNYKFNTPFPQEIEQEKNIDARLKGKIWFIKKQIKQKTYFHTPIQLIKGQPILPKGFCVYNSLYTDNQLDNVYHDIHTLYKSAYKYPEEFGVSDQRKTRGLTYLFTTPDPTDNRPSIQQTLSLLQKYKCKHLIRCILTYLDYIGKLYQVDIATNPKTLQKYISIGLLRYEPEYGIWLNIDNIERSGQGPICTVSIGPPVVYYDLTPALVEDKKARPLRVVAPQGSLIIMDGPSRMEWAHGLPFGVPIKGGKIKYTLTFKCESFHTLSPVYNKLLDHKITLSKEGCGE